MCSDAFFNIPVVEFAILYVSYMTREGGWWYLMIRSKHTCIKNLLK